MKRMTWEDMYGKKHRLHSVRANRGSFMVIDLLRNVVVIEHAGNTRKEAWDALREMEAEYEKEG